jgi:cell division protein FtsB
MSRAASFLRERWPRLLGCALLAAVLICNQGFRSLVNNWIELRSLRREIVELDAEEAQLSERLRLLRAGGPSLERMARKELGYIKKGEIEYRFPPPGPAKR